MLRIWLYQGIETLYCCSLSTAFIIVRIIAPTKGEGWTH
jgi:hypothetical protein